MYLILNRLKPVSVFCFARKALTVSSIDRSCAGTDRPASGIDRSVASIDRPLAGITLYLISINHPIVRIDHPVASTDHPSDSDRRLYTSTNGLLTGSILSFTSMNHPDKNTFN